MMNLVLQIWGKLWAAGREASVCILPLKRLPGVSRATIEVVYRFPRKRRVYPKNIASQSVQFCPPGVFGKVRRHFNCHSWECMWDPSIQDARGQGFFKPLTKHRTDSDSKGRSSLKHQPPEPHCGVRGLPVSCPQSLPKCLGLRPALHHFPHQNFSLYIVLILKKMKIQKYFYDQTMEKRLTVKMSFASKSPRQNVIYHELCQSK